MTTQRYAKALKPRPFQDIALLNNTRQFFREPSDLGFLIRLPLRLRELRHPTVQRFGADPELFGHLLDRMTPLLNLSHRADLELI